MADKKWTDYPEATALTDDDILALTDAPGGAAASKKITVANLKPQLRIGAPYPIEILLSEGGGVIATGPKFTVHVREAGNLGAWLVGPSDNSGGFGMQIWKSTRTSLPPVQSQLILSVGHSIGNGLGMSAWSDSVSPIACAVHDVLQGVMVHNSGVTRSLVSLSVWRT